MGEKSFRLNLRTQRLGVDENGRAQWEVTLTERLVPADRTALILCDVWDRHWSRGPQSGWMRWRRA